MAVQDYKELIVWQKSVDFAEQIYSLTTSFPPSELYGLTKQIRRAAVSVASNIAEGQGRSTTGEFRHFLGIARGSLLEVETQLYIAQRLGYVEQDATAKTFTMFKEIVRMLNGLISALPISPGIRKSK